MHLAKTFALFFNMTSALTQFCSHPTSKPIDANVLLHKALGSMGALESIHNINTFSFKSPSIYRSQTLTQNYNLQSSDQSVADAGAQVLSFRIKNHTLQERIDRSYAYNDYWIWAFPSLQPSMNYSLVLQDGSNGFASFNQGQNGFFAADPTLPLGFVDGYLTDYLVTQAHQYALPWLLRTFAAEPGSLTTCEIIDPSTGLKVQGIGHTPLGLTLILNSTSYLPYMVRSYEDHVIFGNSTSEMVFTNYSSVPLASSNHSVLLPHRVQTIYNSINVLEDFVIDSIQLNPNFSEHFFTPRSTSSGQMDRSPPAQSEEYPRSEVHEFYEAGLWNGAFGEGLNTSDVKVEYPVPGVKEIKSVYVGYADYVQLLIEFEDGLLVTDAAPHRSKILIDWVHQNMRGKQIKYVVPSHHHRDHAGGIADYLAAGAKLVIPEVAKDYYAKVNGGDFETITYTDKSPFIHKDGKVQFRSFWHPENPHARDWTYALASAVCTEDDSDVVLFNADVVSPGTDPSTSSSEGMRWDIGYARQWLVTALSDGIPRSAVIQGAHGSSSENGISNSGRLETVIGITGFDYPPISPKALRHSDQCKAL